MRTLLIVLTLSTSTLSFASNQVTLESGQSVTVACPQTIKTVTVEKEAEGKPYTICGCNNYGQVPWNASGEYEIILTNFSSLGTFKSSITLTRGINGLDECYEIIESKYEKRCRVTNSK